MRSMTNEWTAPRLEILHEVYGYLPNVEVAEIINAATGSYFDGHGVKTKFGKLKQAKKPTVPRPQVWGDELDALLRKLVSEGLSLSGIATEINEQKGTRFTRNSVAGAINRRGLFAARIKGQPRIERADKMPRPRRQRYYEAPVLRLFNPIGAVESKSIEFFDLEPHHCRYITHGEGFRALFCGHDQTDKSSYCEVHHDLCCQPPQQRSVNRARYQLKAA